MSSRAKILQAASDSFYRNGYLATSVDAILQQTGVSKSNFYYHFRSKEDLGIAVLDARWRDFEATLHATLLDDGRDPRERLVAFLDGLVVVHGTSPERYGCPFGNLVAEMADHSERFRCQLSGMFRGLATGIAGVVEQGQSAGQFRPDIDPRSAAELVVQATQGMHLMAKCHKDLDGRAGSLDLLIGLLAPPLDREAAVSRAA